MCSELFSANGTVYKVTCLANNRSYVGQTGKYASFFDRYGIKKSIANKTQAELFSYLSDRFKEVASRRARDFCEELMGDVHIYAPEQFSVTLLAKDIENDDERDNLELTFIKKYKCIDEGYNITTKTNNLNRGKYGFPYSLIDLKTMKKIKGSNITDFCRKLFKRESITHSKTDYATGLLEKVRRIYMDIPKRSKTKYGKNKNVRRSTWPISAKHLSYLGYAPSWMLENGVPDHMEIVPHEYDTDFGKITRPLLKIKDNLDPEQEKERKETLKQELTNKITQSAILYAEKLAEEFKYTLDAPFGPGGMTSYLNKKILAHNSLFRKGQRS